MICSLVLLFMLVLLLSVLSAVLHDSVLQIISREFSVNLSTVCPVEVKV